MTITIMTLFPEYFTTPLQQSMLGRAQNKEKVVFEVWNIRDFALGKHAVTDDRPYGGGPGMVLMVEPVDRAVAQWREQHPAATEKTACLLTSAKGALFTQETARTYSEYDAVAIVCGHYEGVDERIARYVVDAEVRIGEYVLTGGEPAALVMTDAITRLLPGVLGNAQSTENESHAIPGQLGFPQYTRPAVYKGWQVPEILLGGHHAQIDSWRSEQKK